MQLPNAEVRKAYISRAKVIEQELKAATADMVNRAELIKVQAQIDRLAEKYQYDKAIGSARYKLYELQAFVHYFNGEDDDALDFIIQAIDTRGGTYARAEKLKARLYAGNKALQKTGLAEPGGNIPLQLQAHIRGLRSSAVIMAVLSILSLYFIPWSIFYIILAVKLNPQRVPSIGIVKAAAWLTLPLCVAAIPIIVDIEFWKMSKKLQKYNEQGAKIFMSDKDYAAGEPSRKKSRKIVLIVLMSFIAFLILLFSIAVGASMSSSQKPAYQATAVDLASQSVRGLKAQTSLPREVDSVTTLTDVTSEQNTIHYHYVLHDADTSALSDEILRDNIRPKTCTETSVKDLLDQGVNMEFTYIDKNSNEQFSFDLTKGDC